MNIEPIEPKAGPHGFSVFAYDYEHAFLDKIYYSTIDSELTQKTKEAVKHVDVPHNSSLAGNIEKEFLLYGNDYNYLGGLLEPIKNKIFSHCSRILNATPEDCTLVNMWVNFQCKNEFNPIHTHEGTFSFVWYLDIPDEIRSEWKSTNSNSPTRGCINFVSSLSNNNIVMNPKTNDLFVFRSSQMHQVYPFESDVTRISVSGNIIVTDTAVH